MNGRLVTVSAVTSVALIALALTLDGTGQIGWETAARWTARHSFLWFLAAFSATAFAHRRGLGLSFAAAHFIHFYAVLQALGHGVQRPVFVFAIGGAGYVLLAAMALTSNDWSQRALGRWWKRLHRVGIWTLFAIFFVNYVGRIARPGSQLIGVWGVALLMGVALFKIWPGLRRIRTAPSSPPSSAAPGEP